MASTQAFAATRSLTVTFALHLAILHALGEGAAPAIHALETAQELKELTARVGVPFIYKSSFDKANRTSSKSYRGPGLEEGLHILEEVKSRIGVPVAALS